MSSGSGGAGLSLDENQRSAADSELRGWTDAGGSVVRAERLPSDPEEALQPGERSEFLKRVEPRAAEEG